MSTPLNIVGCRGVVQLGVPASGFVQGGPAKEGACKAGLFTESFCLVKIMGLVKSVTKMVTGCYKNDKSCYTCIIRLKVFFNENMSKWPRVLVH